MLLYKKYTSEGININDVHIHTCVLYITLDVFQLEPVNINSIYVSVIIIWWWKKNI